ncbi:hypothetical protein EDB81DRAFT_857552 [Dactylonectria macrodidyma]|uniref:Peptidase C14 caspase domain-containing protein n=1 Tax=Dactylonectria macrodidyma TaxID=307937 RepID=A0A9P9EQH1_9HYPO|nr:hypothetical protein EDB81DRAFT_857552 [Dactylonectria macrodidyma]
MGQHGDGLARLAILVGIDSYEGNAHQNLRGCVNDALAVEQFFLNNMDVPQDSITKLLAPCTNGTISMHPGASLPTFHNIVKSLEKIRDSGDEVNIDILYIHYSAHGIDLKTANHTLPGVNDNIMDEKNKMWMALATFDTFSQKKYLSGRLLEDLIRGIIGKKGARVCLVLDSCHSGGGFRGDEDWDNFQPRLIEVDEAELDAMGSPDSSDQNSTADPSCFRNSKNLKSNWLIAPDRCTVVAACGTNQRAGEANLGGKMHGVLTYWMLNVLHGNLGPGSSFQSYQMPSYSMLRHDVEEKVGASRGNHSRTKPQTPVVLGEAGIRFFGNDAVFQRPYCKVLDVGKPWLRGKVCLNVGESQGVAVGAVYVILSKAKSPVTVRIDSVYEFHSIGELANTQGTTLPDIGDLGLLKTWALPKPCLVELDIDDDESRRVFKEEIEKTANLLCQDKPSNLKVDINSGIFKVHETSSFSPKSRRLPRIPLVACDEPHAIQKIAYIIRHITRHMAIQGLLGRPRATAQLNGHQVTCGCFHPGTNNELERDETGAYVITEGVELELSINYAGTSGEVLWVAIFELNKDWGIQKVFPEDEASPGLARGGMYRLELQFEMEIPPKCVKDDPSEVLDQFIVFGCVADDGDIPSWDEISLPPLPTTGSSMDLNYFDNGSEKEFRNAPAYRGSKNVKIVRDMSQPTSRNLVTLGFQIRTIPE